MPFTRTLRLISCIIFWFLSAQPRQWLHDRQDRRQQGKPGSQVDVQMLVAALSILLLQAVVMGRGGLWRALVKGGGGLHSLSWHLLIDASLLCPPACSHTLSSVSCGGCLTSTRATSTIVHLALASACSFCQSSFLGQVVDSPVCILQYRVLALLLPCYMGEAIQVRSFSGLAC